MSLVQLENHMDQLGNILDNGWPLCPACGNSIAFTDDVEKMLIDNKFYLVHQHCNEDSNNYIGDSDE